MLDPYKFEDFTCRPCPLGSEPSHYGDNNEYHDNDMPMYSFERPAHNYWNGVCNYLRDKGCNDEQIAETLAHKHMRWMLDHGPFDDAAIAKLGYESAQAYFQNKPPNTIRGAKS